MKKIKADVINKLIATTAVLFFLSSILTIMVEADERNVFHATYQQLLSDINQVNQRDEEDDTERDEQQMAYQNGVEAFLSGYYDGFVDKDSYHVETFGKSYYTASISGHKVATIETYVYTKMIKFDDGNAVYELISYDENSSYNRTIAQYIYYEKFTDTVYRRDSTDVTKQGDRLTANYDESEGWLMQEADEFVAEIGVLPGSNIFEFSENNLTEESHRVSSGNHDVVLNADPRSAAQKYRRFINFFSGSSTMPTVSKLGIRARVNEEGELKIFRLDEEYRMTMEFSTRSALEDYLGKNLSSVIGTIFSPKVNIKAESNIAYNFIQLGGEIDYDVS